MAVLLGWFSPSIAVRDVVVNVRTKSHRAYLYRAVSMSGQIDPAQGPLSPLRRPEV